MGKYRRGFSVTSAKSETYLPVTCTITLATDYQVSLSLHFQSFPRIVHIISSYNLNRKINF